MDQAAAEELKRTKEERDYFKAAYTRKLDECIKVLSQLSASEERVAHLENSLNMYWMPTAKNEERLKLHWQERYEKLAESLLPSPPQVDIRG